ncbi:ribosomal protein L13A [Wallemia mellicola]|nr:ribosomal protein L13A [Wallemia mellicola]
MSTYSAAPVIVDGRLASVVAKNLLNGNRVVVVRCEELNLSGSFFRRKLEYMKFMRLRHLVKPSKGGPFHHRAPSRIFLKAVRGMIPHKIARGAAAMQRLKVFEGVPPLYQNKKKMVVPQALRVLRLKPGRKFCTLKRLSSEFGWAHAEVVDKLEAKRKAKGAAYHERKVAATKLRANAFKDAPQNAKLAEFVSLSKYHFLILPRKSSDLPSYPNSLDDLLNFDDDIINKVLDTLDRTLTQVEESIHDMQLRDYGKTWDINKGFHAVPSLNCIHLHVMSNDLISDRLKNKKHYNSFHPGKGFFIHFDDVCKAVENGTKEQLRSSLKAKEVLLKDPLQSHYNGKIYTNIPKLKTHLVEYFNDNVINNH